MSVLGTSWLKLVLRDLDHFRCNGQRPVCFFSRYVWCPINDSVGPYLRLDKVMIHGIRLCEIQLMTTCDNRRSCPIDRREARMDATFGYQNVAYGIDRVQLIYATRYRI